MFKNNPYPDPLLWNPATHRSRQISAIRQQILFWNKITYSENQQICGTPIWESKKQISYWKELLYSRLHKVFNWEWKTIAIFEKCLKNRKETVVQSEITSSSCFTFLLIHMKFDMEVHFMYNPIFFLFFDLVDRDKYNIYLSLRSYFYILGQIILLYSYPGSYLQIWSSFFYSHEAWCNAMVHCVFEMAEWSDGHR